MSESVEVQRLRQMLKAARPLLRELAIACAKVEEELEREAQTRTAEEAQHGRDREDAERYCAA